MEAQIIEIELIKDTAAPIQAFEILQEQSEKNMEQLSKLNDYMDQQNTAFDVYEAGLEAFQSDLEALKKQIAPGDIPEEITATSGDVEKLTEKADSALFIASESKQAIATALNQIENLTTDQKQLITGQEANETFVNNLQAEIVALQTQLKTNDAQDVQNRDETKQYFVQNGTYLEQLNSQLQEVREKVQLN